MAYDRVMGEELRTVRIREKAVKRCGTKSANNMQTTNRGAFRQVKSAEMNDSAKLL